jgi:hypothetical protein
MSAKRSPIDRILTFYREQSPDVVRVTHQLALEVMKARGIGNGPAKSGMKQSRKPKLAKRVDVSGALKVEE